ncbi:DUF6086 family protein [Nocardia sp. NPDC006044]|uniref:DUF6086 family protein n=1 Tax=Nocardia sp. NPDC006044 TaxID=3364306 RepID=UPI00369C0E6A
MSYVFEIDNLTVWSPSLRVGDLYVRMVQDVGEVLAVPTGLSAMASDLWVIDINGFEALVKLMYETYFGSGHHVLKGLIGGVLAPSIVILERGGKYISPSTDSEREFLDGALRLPMAR